MYTYDDSDAVKHCYDVYVRKHAITGTGHWNGLPAISSWLQKGFVAVDTTSTTSLVAYKDETSTDNPYASATDDCWCKIGVIKAEPTLVTDAGETIPLGTCNDKVISKKVTLDFTSLSVNKDNWEEALEIIDNLIDVLYVETGEVTAATEGNGIGAANLQMDSNLNIKGNGLNEMPFTISKEVGNIKKFVNFLDVQLT